MCAVPCVSQTWSCVDDEKRDAGQCLVSYLPTYLAQRLAALVPDKGRVERDLLEVCVDIRCCVSAINAISGLGFPSWPLEPHLELAAGPEVECLGQQVPPGLPEHIGVQRKDAERRAGAGGKGPVQKSRADWWVGESLIGKPKANLRVCARNSPQKLSQPFPPHVRVAHVQLAEGLARTRLKGAV